MPFLIITLYLTCNTGVAGVNIDKMMEVESLILQLGIFQLITSDFNMDPSIIADTRWLTRIAGAIIIPEGVEATCTNGAGLLDYCISSVQMSETIKVKPALWAPWKTHSAFEILIPKAPRGINIRTLVRPAAFPADYTAEGEHLREQAAWGFNVSSKQKAAIYYVGDKSLDWSKSLEIAGNMKARHCEAQETVQSSIMQGREHSHLAGVEAYARWSLATERFILLRTSIPQQQRKGYLRRGTWAQFH